MACLLGFTIVSLFVNRKSFQGDDCILIKVQRSFAHCFSGACCTEEHLTSL
uniref:Uncharacterized protein n=1 Tax=Solanum tuberosum TaxID=4113 RepID=M1AFR7_SOLTU